ncbi:hypothetical protein FACS189475_08710 [Betaproteobacteria bacterium]|nr:hypothetical protein FACS189475_08710 [Betaproteobacteria bacterium]
MKKLQSEERQDKHARNNDIQQNPDQQRKRTSQTHYTTKKPSKDFEDCYEHNSADNEIGK